MVIGTFLDSGVFALILVFLSTPRKGDQLKFVKLSLLMLAAGTLANCVTTPILKPNEVVQITSVTVTKQSEAMGTENLAEDIRVKTQNAAYKVSESGAERSLSITVVGYAGPSPGRALLVGGSTSVNAAIQLTDLDTGAKTKPEAVTGFIYRQGGLLGAAAAGAINPYKEEQLLASKLSEAIVRKIYGDKAVDAARSRNATKSAKGVYAYSYQAKVQEFECRQIAARNQSVREDAEETGDEPWLERVPAYCPKEESER